MRSSGQRSDPPLGWMRRVCLVSEGPSVLRLEEVEPGSEQPSHQPQLWFRKSLTRISISNDALAFSSGTGELS